MPKPFRISALILPILALTACVTSRPSATTTSTSEEQTSGATSGVQTQSATTPEPGAPAETLPPVVRPRVLSPASRALVAQAQNQSTAGNDALAAATLERALRIEPDNPQLWIELAKIKHNQGNEAQAENLARKALTMAAGDGKTQSAAWRVIADSYRARGRNVEAREAELKASGQGG